jgi:hypothetical protein
MNEPQGVNLDSLKKYYKEAYDAVRKYNPNAYVIMSNPLDADSKVLLSFVTGFNKVVLDVHYYNLYSDKFTNMNVQQNIHYINNERASDLSGVSSTNALSFVGKCQISRFKLEFSITTYTIFFFQTLFLVYYQIFQIYQQSNKRYIILCPR